MEGKTMNEVFSIMDILRHNLNEATQRAKIITSVTFAECQALILESLVPMSAARRQIICELSLKISTEEVAANLKKIIAILVRNPKSLDLVSKIVGKLKKIKYSDVSLCLDATLGVKDLRLVYFLNNLSFKCPSSELGDNIIDLLGKINDDPRLSESVRAVLKTIPASDLPKFKDLELMMRQTENRKNLEIISLLARRKELGDKKFIAEGFEKAFKFPEGKLPQVKVHGEHIDIHFSHHLAAHCDINFQDIVSSPSGPAIVAGYKHGSLIIAPIGEFEAFYLDGLALKDFEKCGIKKIGRHK